MKASDDRNLLIGKPSPLLTFCEAPHLKLVVWVVPYQKLFINPLQTLTDMWNWITNLAIRVLNEQNPTIVQHFGDEQIVNMICKQLVDHGLVKAVEIDDDLCESVISNMTLSDFVRFINELGNVLMNRL